MHARSHRHGGRTGICAAERPLGLSLIMVERNLYCGQVLVWGLVLLCIVRDTHNRGGYHCDFKPSYAILAPKSSVVLIDPGISMRADAVLTTEIGGTPVYMAGRLLPLFYEHLSRGEEDYEPKYTARIISAPCAQN
jgi:hypothetical protein